LFTGFLCLDTMRHASETAAEVLGLLSGLLSSFFLVIFPVVSIALGGTGFLVRNSTWCRVAKSRLNMIHAYCSLAVDIVILVSTSWCMMTEGPRLAYHG